MSRIKTQPLHYVSD